MAFKPTPQLVTCKQCHWSAKCTPDSDALSSFDELVLKCKNCGSIDLERKTLDPENSTDTWLQRLSKVISE